MENTSLPSRSEDIPSNVTEATATACAAILELADLDPANLGACLDVTYGFMVLLNFSELSTSMPTSDLNEYLTYLQDAQNTQPDKQQREYEQKMLKHFRGLVQEYIDTHLPEEES